MINKILVGYDDGDLSKKALEAAIEFAKATKAEIFIVSAHDIPIYVSSPVMLPPGDISITKSFYDNTRMYFEKLQEQAAARVKEEGLTVTTKVLEGNPGKSLIWYADEINADLIAIGSNNRGALDKFFIGSVSNYVLQHAKCMILVIKN